MIALSILRYSMGCLRIMTFVDLCSSNNIHRVPQMVYFKQERTSKDGKVGDDVKRAIEENKAILKEERKKRVELPDGN